MNQILISPFDWTMLRFQAYISSKFEIDIPRSESLALIDRVLHDFDVHPLLVEVIIKV